MTDPKLATLRASRAATGQTDSSADLRATYEDATEEALSPLRRAVRMALAAPGAPKRVELARAIDYAPESLTAWLNGRRPAPIDKIEAMLAHLNLVIVPRPISPRSPATPVPAAARILAISKGDPGQS